MAVVNAVTVIDRLNGLDGPPGAVADPAVTAQLARLQAAAVDRDAHGIVELALKGEFAGKTALVSSFGAESAVLLHLMAEIDPSTPVLFLNTGKLFGETLRYRDRLQERLGLGDIRSLAPHLSDNVARDPEGTLWARDTDSCCEFRKVIPLKRALEGFAAQITGRKRFQTKNRAAMQAVEFFEGRFRFNPLADWSQGDLEAYMIEHALPRHPLVEDGYPSIGCMPCTRRVTVGEDYRAGRWAGLEKDECGIHGVDGEGI
ncbi:MAG: phosphoadenylyl-sulfate reductase [Alphaproteobacteria bacterium]|nr:phosphoadenylyl-sulfate reductase [Alphaproteobacteria bacterium]MDE2494574.1 phosphoadenylyl-sulfate reductase [Alphaproteobacteria bacterium]